MNPSGLFAWWRSRTSPAARSAAICTRITARQMARCGLRLRLGAVLSVEHCLSSLSFQLILQLLHYYFTDTLRQRVFDYLTDPIDVDEMSIRNNVVRLLCPWLWWGKGAFTADVAGR